MRLNLKASHLSCKNFFLAGKEHFLLVAERLLSLCINFIATPPNLRRSSSATCTAKPPFHTSHACQYITANLPNHPHQPPPPSDTCTRPPIRLPARAPPKTHLPNRRSPTPPHPRSPSPHPQRRPNLSPLPRAPYASPAEIRGNAAARAPASC